MKTLIPSASTRRGSTLVIVIALLGLLAFLGMVFFSFASSERSSAENFSEAAKGEIDEPDNVWDHAMRHVISGPSNRPSERASILKSPTNRHSIARNLVGSDLSPHSGEGISVVYNGAGLPVVNGPAGNDWLDFVDSPAARGGTEFRPVLPPAPDVDYTYPDINNIFLAYKGWAIRDNGSSAPPPRYERVQVIIPSFFRPQYMKSGTTNGFSGNNVPTDANWASAFNGTNRFTAKFSGRSFRPTPLHIAGLQSDGTTPVYRFLTASEAAFYSVASGGFPFVPDDNPAGQPGGLNGNLGELGIWTGSDPDAYELDADNDGDGIREGIWIDTNFPVQEFVDSTGTTRQYTVLHSFTIYDLDGLINLNVHGNIAGIGRDGTTKSIATSDRFAQFMGSKSNLGLGPNEINPLYALRTNMAAPVTAVTAAQFRHHYGRLPSNNLEQANMEWLWLVSGRAQVDAGGTLKDILAGRWGENERLFNAVKPGGSFRIADLPRPGLSGDAYQTSSSGIRFGGTLSGQGYNGFDDNQDRMDGELNPSLGRVRAFGTPMDYAGTGRSHQGSTDIYDGALFPITGDVRLPLVNHDPASFGPERFLGLSGYTLMRDVDTSVPRYIFGQNGIFDGGTGDDLIDAVQYDALFEDPLETIFDPNLSDRKFDSIFGPQDLFSLHLTAGDLTNPPDDISDRLKKLAPYSLDDANAPFSANEQVTPGVRSRFTTISNSLHRFLMRSPFGADGRPGVAGVDDNGDNIIDNIADLTDPATSFVYGVGDTDSVNRAWEFSADEDGADQDGDGFPDGDGFLEFPPQFGLTATDVRPYSATDPFRPQVRRLLSTEPGEGRGLYGQMPLSPNHLLDVERNAQTPAEGTREFLYYMQRSGLRFRPLTDHPLASETAGVTTLPTWPVPFPPTAVDQREFWARRDRQKLARDIYVLLYTTGGAGLDSTTGHIKDYTKENDASLGEGVSLYTHEQLRRMAQFAVNLVDGMDSDNVMTRFEYDKNLGNGWSLDDDSSTADYAVAVPGDSDFNLATSNGIHREDQTVNGTGVAERGVVYGVEAQELAFSETLGIRSRMTTADHASTPFPDEAMARDFLYVELQNVRPTTVNLGEAVSTTAATAIWQLARFDRTAVSDPVEPMAAPDEVLAILQHAENVVDGGGRFSIGVSSDTGLATSSFFVDTGAGGTFDGTYELIAPDVVAPALPTTMNQTGTSDPAYDPLVDIDVNHVDHNGGSGAARFAAPSGNFVEAVVAYGGNQHIETLAGDRGTFTANGNGFDLVLQRRANPNMPQLSIGDNPWIDVDRTRVTFDNFDVQDMDTPAEIYNPAGMPAPSGHLIAIQSTERREPLDDTRQFQSVAKTATLYRSNTIKGATSVPRSDMLGINSQSLPDKLIAASSTNPALPFEIWQPHFDREYASTGELLSLPLVGPNLLTQRLDRIRYPGYQQSFPDPSDLSTGVQSQALLSSAESMILWPNYTDMDLNADTLIDINDLPGNAPRDNRWYRLLQFVEVPSRVHRMLGNYLAQNRIPGKLNINMIRHREVLAGLIDNPHLADVKTLLDSDADTYEDAPFLASAATLGGRDFFQEFMVERDGRPVPGFNPTNGGTPDFWMPGTPGARPFRAQGAMGSSFAFENQFDRTILRRLVGDRDENNDGIEDGTGDDVERNRNWLELATPAFHKNPGDLDSNGTEDFRGNTPAQRHQILSKVLNNTTTISNTFIVYGTAAYFEVHEDVATGLFQVGGRFDLDEDGDPTNDEQRAVFVIDRTEAFEAYDPGTGDFDWNRLVKARATIK